MYRQQQVALAENIYCTGYVGGNGCKFYHEKSQIQKNTKDHIEADIFALLVPYESGVSGDGVVGAVDEFPNPLSITGSFDHENFYADETDTTSLHYATANFYKNFWGWASGQAGDKDMPYFESYSQYNTVRFQGHQQLYNPSTGLFDIITPGTGHWGDRIYPGCGRVRKGMARMLQPVTFNGATPMPTSTHIAY